MLGDQAREGVQAVLLNKVLYALGFFQFVLFF